MKANRLWTALYLRKHPFDKGRNTCWWIKFGHANGPPIEYKTAVKLARNMFKRDDKLLELCNVRPGGPEVNGYID